MAYSGNRANDLTTTGSFTASGQTISLTGLQSIGSVHIWVSGTFAGITTSAIEGTVDGTNYVALNTYTWTGPSYLYLSYKGNSPSITLATSQYLGANVAGFSAIRIRSTAYTSGTANLSIRASSEPIVLNGTYVAYGDSTAGLTANDVSLFSLAAGMLFNGTNWDRRRSVVNATNSTGTGIAAAGILAQFDDTSPTAITENQFGNIRMSANRNLYGTIRDAAGNERGANVNASNQLSVSVDNSPVLGAGANAIGKLAANSGVDIGDVDITSIISGTGATNLGKAINNTPGATDTGIAPLAVRTNSLTVLTETNGNYTPLRTNTRGAQWVAIDDASGGFAVTDGGGSLTVDGTVSISGTVAVSSINTSVTPGTSAAHLGKAEDAAHTTGDTGVMALAVRNDAGAALAGTDLDYIPLTTDSNGALRVTGGGGGTEYTEDAAAAADPVGRASIIVRKDTPAATVSADGDNIAQRGSNFGAAYVTLVDSSGGFVSVGGGTQYAEDVAHVSGNTGTMSLGVRNDAQTVLTSADGDYSPLATDGAGNIRIVGSVAAGATDSGHAIKVGGKYNSTLPTYTDGQRFELQSDSTGALVTRLYVGGNPVPGVATNADGVAASATVSRLQGVSLNYVYNGTTFDRQRGDTTGTWSTIRDAAGNARGANVNASNQLSVSVDNTVTVASHAVTNAGTFATQESGAALTSLQLLDDTIFTDDAAFTPGTSKVTSIGFQADETSTDSVDEGDIGAPRMTLDRKQIVTNNAHTQGGATPFKLISAASTNATSVKASAGQVYMITASNVNAAARYLKIYNKASAPTVGTDTPLLVFLIPGNTAGAGTNIPIMATGMEFTTGIAFALTTGVADSDTGAVAANELVVNLGYK